MDDDSYQRTPGGGSDPAPSGALGGSGTLRTDVPQLPADATSDDTLGHEEPGAGVTDVRGRPLAGSHGGGGPES
jgi:hypothetical protein